MFETLFSRPAAIQHHYTGPYANERVAYREQRAAPGTPRTTMRIRAHYCLGLARELAHWPQDYQFTQAEIDTIAVAGATQSVASGRAATPENPKHLFRSAAGAFLRSLDRLRLEPSFSPGRYADRLEAFLEDQRQNRGQSEATCRSGHWKVASFLSYVEDHGYDLDRLDASHGDASLQPIAHRLSQTSLRTVALGLRAWFRDCETQGGTTPGLADAILVPRVYQHESLPLGPTWDPVSRMLEAASGEEPANLRNRASLLLLAVYGLRSGAVRRWPLDDVDWQQDRIRLHRSKSGRLETFPLEPSIGHAMARSLCGGRPPSQNRRLFRTLRAPYRSLSDGALRHLVRRYLSIVGLPAKG